MQSRGMHKFAFRIRTRAGPVVDKLLIPGRDAEEAERKLRQIYRDCEILSREARQPAARAADGREIMDGPALR
ncbi:MAG TPA: hypothetical protein PKC23_11965 [Candidatus Desulfobacillus sp.]|nr:hypothetical protein [Candidatus Desulfobacillus sp.]